MMQTKFLFFIVLINTNQIFHKENILEKKEIHEESVQFEKNKNQILKPEVVVEKNKTEKKPTNVFIEWFFVLLAIFTMVCGILSIFRYILNLISFLLQGEQNQEQSLDNKNKKYGIFAFSDRKNLSLKNVPVLKHICYDNFFKFYLQVICEIEKEIDIKVEGSGFLIFDYELVCKRQYQNQLKKKYFFNGEYLLCSDGKVGKKQSDDFLKNIANIQEKKFKNWKKKQIEKQILKQEILEKKQLKIIPNNIGDTFFDIFLSEKDVFAAKAMTEQTTEPFSFFFTEKKQDLLEIARSASLLIIHGKQNSYKHKVFYSFVFFVLYYRGKLFREKTLQDQFNIFYLDHSLLQNISCNKKKDYYYFSGATFCVFDHKFNNIEAFQMNNLEDLDIKNWHSFLKKLEHIPVIKSIQPIYEQKKIKILLETLSNMQEKKIKEISIGKPEKKKEEQTIFDKERYLYHETIDIEKVLLSEEEIILLLYKIKLSMEYFNI